MRRLALSAMLVFFGEGSAAQVVIAMFICNACIKVVSYYEPYIALADDRLAEASQWVVYCALFAALLIRVDATGDSDEDQKHFGILLIVVSSMPIAVMTIMTVSEYSEQIGAMLRDREESTEALESREVELEEVYLQSATQPEQFENPLKRHSNQASAYIARGDEQKRNTTTPQTVELVQELSQTTAPKPEESTEETSQSPPEPGVLDGWEQIMAPSGHYYWVNHSTGASQWEAPFEQASAQWEVPDGFDVHQLHNDLTTIRTQFQEASGGSQSITFEQCLKHAEIHEWLDDGQLSEETVKQFWDEFVESGESTANFEVS